MLSAALIPSTHYCEQDQRGLHACEQCEYSACADCLHDEAKSTCRCPSANFGLRTAIPHHRLVRGWARPVARDGTGPFKSLAQVRMERRLPSCSPGLVKLTRCSYYGCYAAAREEVALCTKCRSVVYCSAQCAASAWQGEPPQAIIPDLAQATGGGVESGGMTLNGGMTTMMMSLDPNAAGLPEIQRAAAAALAAAKRKEEVELIKALEAKAALFGAANSGEVIAAAEQLKTLKGVSPAANTEEEKDNDDGSGGCGCERRGGCYPGGGIKHA